MTERHQSKRFILLNRSDISTSELKSGVFYRLSDDQVKHFKKVLRLEWGTEVYLADGCGFVYNATIEQENDKGGVRIGSLFKSETNKNEIVLHLGFSKNSTMDFVIEKAVECGVSQVIPIVTSRSVVRPKKDELDKYCTRWKKIANEACEQSERSISLKISKPIEWNDWVQSEKKKSVESLKIAFVSEMRLEESNENLLKNTWKTLKSSKSHKVDFCIGPEGGFHLDELEDLKAANFTFCSLGSKVYRVETASIVASTLVQLSCVLD